MLTPFQHRLDVEGADTAGETVVQFFKSELQSAKLSNADPAAERAAAAQLTAACTSANEFAAAEAAIEAAYACARPASRRYMLAMKLALQANSAQQAMKIAAGILLPPLQATDADAVLSGVENLGAVDPSLDVEVRAMRVAVASMTCSRAYCVLVQLTHSFVVCVCF